jgi:hypothetical protein
LRESPSDFYESFLGTRESSLETREFNPVIIVTTTDIVGTAIASPTPSHFIALY